MKRGVFLSLFAAVAVLAIFNACKHEPFAPPPAPADQYGNYPPAVGAIIMNNCVRCHNTASKSANADLDLSTWDHLFDGYSNGAAVVAYWPDYSPLLYAINTTDAAIPTLAPTMPNDATALSPSDYNTIKTWIASGAPDKNGVIPFSSSPLTRQKTYITQQGCNLVAVVDNERQVVMRYINMDRNSDKSPHVLHISPDGQYAYVCYAAGKYVQKINTTTDSIVAQADINPGGGQGAWNAFAFNKDGTKMAVADLTGNKIAVFNTTTMSDALTYTGFSAPHGIISDDNFDTLYITSQYGNAIYKITLADGNYKEISVDGKPIVHSSAAPATPDPHNLCMVPGGDKYFVTCQGDATLRLMDAHADTLIQLWHVGAYPQEFAISTQRHQVYFTCTEGPERAVGSVLFKGSVYIVDYTTMQLVDSISTINPLDPAGLCQPHGVAVDDQNGYLIIPSRNVTSFGPAPHHTSNCGTGRNGFYNFYNLDTRRLVKRRFEVTPDAYGTDVRFKKN